ncbi:photosystem I P700 apoprotein A2, chloroplastic [Tanacetum coccineum]
MGVVLGGTSRMTVPRNSTVLRAAIVVDPAEHSFLLRLKSLFLLIFHVIFVLVSHVEPGQWNLYAQNPDSSSHLFGTSQGAGTAILTLLGGFHPQTQSLWLTDMAHHHLAIDTSSGDPTHTLF